MITKGTKITIKYKNFSDKDLMYIVRLVNETFNEELAKRLQLGQGERYKRLHAPLEIQEVKTGHSITLDFYPDLELILVYIGLRFGEEILRAFSNVVEDELKEVLKNSIQKAVKRFKKRRRKDNLEDFSCQ